MVITGVRTEVEAKEEKDESYFTVELIENSSWDDLEQEEHNNRNTKEDVLVLHLISGISHQKQISAYPDFYYVSYGIGGIQDEEVNTDRLFYKFELIIELYNQTHDVQLTMEKLNYPNHSKGVMIQSEKPDYIKYMVHLTGSLAHVKPDTKYWESAQNFGAGKNGKISDAMTVKVNGVAYLNEYGEIIHNFYGNNPHRIKTMAPRMLHICTGDTDLGWVYPTQLTSIDG